MRKKWRFVDWTARFAHIAMQFQWEPRGFWVGVLWDGRRGNEGHTGWDRHHGAISSFPWSLHIYVCVIPTLPLHIYIWRTLRPIAAGVSGESDG